MIPRLEEASLDARLVNAVSSATAEVLRTMAKTESSLKAVNASPKYVSAGDISAIIGITGETGEGMVGISFPMSLASLLVSRLIGLPVAKVTSEDRCDAVGELANMISGRVKVMLSEDASSLYKLSLPTVILGANHEISNHPKNAPFLTLTFEAEGQDFTMQLCFRANY